MASWKKNYNFLIKILKNSLDGKKLHGWSDLFPPSFRSNDILNIVLHDDKRHITIKLKMKDKYITTRDLNVQETKEVINWLENLKDNLDI